MEEERRRGWLKSLSKAGPITRLGGLAVEEYKKMLDKRRQNSKSHDNIAYQHLFRTMKRSEPLPICSLWRLERRKKNRSSGR